MRSEGGVFINEISALIKETPLSSSSSMWGHREKPAVCNPEEDLHQSSTTRAPWRPVRRLLLFFSREGTYNTFATLWTVGHQALHPRDFLGKNTEVVGISFSKMRSVDDNSFWNMTPQGLWSSKEIWGREWGKGRGFKQTVKNVTGAKFKKFTKSKRTNSCFYYSY